MPRFQTLPEVLQHWAQEKPDSAAFVFLDKDQQRSVLTWRWLYTLSGRFAAVLKSQGRARGDLVVNTLPNSPERVVCEAGLWLAGMASVNGQCLMADGSDLLRTITVSRAPAILVDPDVTDSPWNALKSRVVRDDEGRVTSSELPRLKRVIFVRRVENEGKGDFIGGLKAQGEWFQADDVIPEDVFTVMTTSGTTGFSKFVMHQQGPFIQFLQRGDTVISVIFGGTLQLNIAQMGWLGGCLIYPIVSGATRVACDVRAGNPDDMARFIWTAIQNEKCRSALFAPTHFPKLAQLAETANKARHSEETWKMDGVVIGGLPVTRSMVEAGLMLARNVCVGYGASDCGAIAGWMVTDSQNFTDYDNGEPFAGVDVKIVSTKDESKLCGEGQLGTILVKTPMMMKEYLHNPQATADAFTEEGFFRTGDLGRLDERGHLIVEGRGSDAVMRGVYIFYPSWIETRLQDCPGVKEVAVVGVPDPVLHEELCACVVLRSERVSMEQVRQFAQGVFVSAEDPLSACPRHFVQFDSFPLTDFGKIKRKDIKAQAADRLRLTHKSD